MTVTIVNDTALYKGPSGESKEAVGVYNIGLSADTNAQAVQPALTANFWNYACPTGGIVNTTTAVTVKAAAGAGVRNYIEGIQLSWDSLTAGGEFAIRDGASGTVLWRFKIPTAAAGQAHTKFGTALRGSANTLLEVVTLTASGAGGVFVDVQGWTGI